MKLGFNQKIDPKKLVEALSNLVPAETIGCRLITSPIMQGYDQPRSDIIKKIEEFEKKKVKRTNLIARYSETKNMIPLLPKEGPFIMLYKTPSSRIVGTFSSGLKKPTFIFAFWAEKLNKNEEKIREQSAV